MNAMRSLPDVHASPVGRATIGDQMRRHGRTNPNKLAVIYYGPTGDRVETTYRELDQRTNRYARAFMARGVTRGDRVAMMSHNSTDYLAAYYAALKIGAAFTGVNYAYKDDEILYQVGHSAPRLLIVEDTFCDKVAALLDRMPSVEAWLSSSLTGVDVPDGWVSLADAGAEQDASDVVVDVDEHDLALIIYTSGTEARPKGVMIPHRNYLISTTQTWSWALEVVATDTWLYVMPYHTIAGLGGTTSLTLIGATLVLPYAVDPASCLEIVHREGVTVIAQTPTFFLKLAHEEGFSSEAVSSVNRCFTYGGLVPAAMIEAWSAVRPGMRWGTYWGQSELTQLGSFGWFRTLDEMPDGDPSWVGKPLTNLEVRVVNEDGADSDLGELICRSPSTMLGYYNDPERTAETIKDGWLHTGDMMRLDGDGNLFFYDRVKDMIKTGGMNVSSQEVERTLQSHPDVMIAAVVGVQDDYWSEAVTAFVVPQPGRDAPRSEALIALCKGELSGYKVPRAVHLVDNLPRDPQGKILKRELRKLAAAAQP